MAASSGGHFIPHARLEVIEYHLLGQKVWNDTCIYISSAYKKRKRGGSNVAANKNC